MNDRSRMFAGLCTALSLVALALWPTLAAATPPVLTSVVVAQNENHPLSTWTLPAGVSSQFIQVSRSSEVNEDDYFTTLETFSPVAKTQTTLLDEFEYADGVYYLHVAGHDQKCTGEATCSPIEFSQVMSFQVPGIGSGPGGTLPPTGGGPGPGQGQALPDAHVHPGAEGGQAARAGPHERGRHPAGDRPCQRAGRVQGLQVQDR